MSHVIRPKRATKRYPAIRCARTIFSRAVALCVRRDASNISQTAAVPRSTKTMPTAELKEAGNSCKSFMKCGAEDVRQAHVAHCFRLGQITLIPRQGIIQFNRSLHG